MFERRLKIFLAIICALAAVMLVRATQLQVGQRTYWRKRAGDLLNRPALVETSRGKIFDRAGRKIVYDDACIDAAVDYRAIVLDPEWIRAQAKARLRARADLPKTISREQLLADEAERVKSDIEHMWPRLAKVCGKDPEEIEQTKQDVMRRVLLLRRNAWYKRYAKTTAAQESHGPTPWYKRWLVDARQEDDEDKTRDAGLDASAFTVGEQVQAHVIVPDVKNEQEIELRKMLPQCPGLELRESTHREYDPLAAVAACHVLGRLTAVDDQDLKRDTSLDPGRCYLPRDLIGRGGLEGLAEPILRGARGQVNRRPGDREAPLEIAKPVPGGDAVCSIDVELQAKVLEAFKSVSVRNPDHTTSVLHDLHGAAIVMDVATNEVLVMASYPTFDMNRFEQDYAKLAIDDLNQPLLNRATRAQHEPGSTVKTIIGSVAVTEGVIAYDKGIQCTGYLQIPDWRTGQLIRLHATNRCWVASMYEHMLGPTGVAHHPVPVPHVGRYGNADGYLVLADALERSCNTYFQTVADRMELRGVTAALKRFGLGEKTGIMIPEASGQVPEVHPLRPGAAHESEQDRHASWLAGIGQGQVAATPIQMANVAATLARGGIRMRPRLLHGASADAVYTPSPDDHVDLHLSPIALAAVKEGMINVVNSPAGTGDEPRRTDMKVAGKTGSAQASKLSIPIRDANGKVMREADTNGIEGKGPALRTVIQPNTLPWYIGVGENGQHLAHAWFIGYAPADKPQIAFCVFVEYGGGGGRVAGAIAREVLQACVNHNYLIPEKQEGIARRE
jgi:penicillin-binding protein 2